MYRAATLATILALGGCSSLLDQANRVTDRYCEELTQQERLALRQRQHASSDNHILISCGVDRS